jgi:hypothetical protein|nr:MAG TPA: hypothetical protein [Caudoviricetes sp.]
MKTWKDETIKRELNRLAEGLQEVDKTIISYVRISMGNLSNTRTVTVYTDFAKNEWLFKATFDFDVNTMTLECRGVEPCTNRISSLKGSVNACIETFNCTFDEFEYYYGVPYKHYLSTTEAEDVAEETTDEPTPEEADREVTYIDFKPEQDYSEDEQKEIAETVAGVGLELLEKELIELERLEEESDKADDAWDKDPLNAELEAASSKAYEKEWKKYMDAAKTLARLISMDTKTARQMLQRGSKNREKVWNYLNRRKIYESK